MTTSNKPGVIRPPSLQLLLQHPAHFFALGMGSGLSPKAPGTFGSLVGLPLFWLISPYGLAWQLRCYLCLGFTFAMSPAKHWV